MTDVRTGAVTPLSVGLTQQRSPSTSPDGSKIVFTAGGSGYDLVAVPLNGSPMRDFLATGSDEYSGAWVPGSSRYVYLTNKNGEEELRIHSQTEDWDRLIVAIRTFGETTTMSAPVASPDGKHVAFDVYGAGGESSVWISPVGGGAPIRLSPVGVTENAPVWSPDGQSIVCLHQERGVVGVATIHVGAGDPPRMIAHGTEGVIPAWSPRSDWIAYRTRDAIRLVSPDGARQRVLTASNVSRDRSGTSGIQRSSGLTTVEVSTRSDAWATVPCSWSRSTPRPGPSASSARWGRTSISARRLTPVCALRWRRTARASSRRSCVHARTSGSSRTSRHAEESSTGSAGVNHRTERIELSTGTHHPPTNTGAAKASVRSSFDASILNQSSAPMHRRAAIGTKGAL